jgi:phage-related protein
MKSAIFHPKAREIIKTFPLEVKKTIGKSILDLQKGYKLTLPLSKPMPSIGLGVEELRIKDSSGAYRVFYYKKYAYGVLVFHAFVKKTQKTPAHEIDIGKKRLKEMLYEEK